MPSVGIRIVIVVKAWQLPVLAVGLVTGWFPLRMAALEVVPAPNIVVLLADDLGWRDLACTGHEHHRTPNLDRLRREGMLFTDAHAAAPICSASRAALLTGKSPARLQYEFVPKFDAGRQQGPWPMVTPDFPTELPPATPTVASRLKSAGYATAFAGKWHLNRHQGHYLGWRPGHGPESFGFDHTFNDFGAHPYGYGKEKPATLKGDDFPDDSLTTKAVDFIRRDHGRPFLLWLSFYQVHDPFHSPCADRVAWHQARLPANADPKRAHYAAMVETLDHEVGRVLAALEATGKSSNTLVVFTSDNGGHPEVSANGPLRGSKWNLYQGGLRVPLLIRWPGKVPANATCGDILTGMDLPATLLDAAGTPAGTATDGTRMLPRLMGVVDPPISHDRSLIWHFPFYQPETRYEQTRRGTGVNDFAISQTQPQAAIREGRWKLIHHFETDRDELFDLRSDPSESADLTKSDPERAAAMRASLFTRLAECGARLPRPKP
jgi:uncharacterized sulfatase